MGINHCCKLLVFFLELEFTGVSEFSKLRNAWKNKVPILNLHFRFLFVETRHAFSLQSIATKRTIVNGDLISIVPKK